MGNRTLESYKPGLQFLRTLAAQNIAGISTSSDDLRDNGTPDSEWFKTACLECVAGEVISGIAFDLASFYFDCLGLHHNQIDDLAIRLTDILQADDLLVDVVTEMVDAEREKLSTQPIQPTSAEKAPAVN